MERPVELRLTRQDMFLLVDYFISQKRDALARGDGEAAERYRLLAMKLHRAADEAL